MEHKTNQEMAQEFYNEAAIYCRDVEKLTVDYMMLRRFIRDLLRIYALAGDLPSNIERGEEPYLDIEGQSFDVPEVRLFDGYYAIENPYRKTPLVRRSIREDMNNIYQDLKEGMIYFESGYHNSALHTWKQSFDYNWGTILPGLLNALFLADKKEDEDIEAQNGTIYHHKAKIWPARGYEITVLNRSEDNVIIENDIKAAFVTPDRSIKTYSIPKKDIDSLIEMIESCNLLFNDNIAFEEGEYSILDGQSDLFFVNNLTDHIYVEESNFVLEHQGMGSETKAGQLIAVHNMVDNILKKNRIGFEQ